MKRSGIACIATAVFLAWAGAASAFVLASGSAAQKHRKDLAKQITKHTSCVTKAVLKCEKKGAESGLECDTITGVAAGTVDQKAAAKFPLDLAKCADKFSATKKGNDYQAVGCPGDCNSAAPGLQQCADLNAYEASVEGTTGAAIRASLPGLAALVELSCINDTGDVADSPAVIDCAINDSKRLAKYAQGVFKCGEACEDDYKNKKGNGGDNDLPLCQVGNGGAAAAFTTCLSKKADKHLAKLTFGPASQATTKFAIDTALNQASNDLFNRDNPAEDPDTTVCGTCGNGSREGAEECDLADDVLCGGPCNADCTCP